MSTQQLSEHFTLAEFTYSQTASRMGLDNTPTTEAYVHLQKLADTMEKVRALCGSNPVTITSGYRSPEVNAACGGSATSAHMSGLAADFVIYGFGSSLDICKAIEPFMDDWDIDQLIHEYGDWVHLGLCPKSEEARCQALTINNSGTTTGFA